MPRDGLAETPELPSWFGEGGLFAGISDQTRAQIRDALQPVRYPSGARIFTYGEPADHMIYLVSGEVRVYRPDGPDRVEIEVNRLTGGQVLGELAYVTMGARTASAEATREVEGWILPFSTLDAARAADPGVAVLYRHIAEQLALGNLRADDARVASAVELSLAAKLLITVIAIQSGTLIATGLMTQLFREVSSSTSVLLGYLLFVSVIGVIYTRFIRLPRRNFGVTTRDAWPALREALVATAVVMALSLALKWAIVRFIPDYSHVPIFDYMDITKGHGRSDAEQHRVLLYSVFGYTFAGFFQELYARGMLQGQLYRILRPRTENPWPAILVSNLLFASIHVSWSMTLTVLSFIGGLLWGWLYARRPNLLGVTVSHILVGLWVLTLLNLTAVFRFGPLSLGR